MLQYTIKWIQIIKWQTSHVSLFRSPRVTYINSSSAELNSDSAIAYFCKCLGKYLLLGVSKKYFLNKTIDEPLDGEWK